MSLWTAPRDLVCLSGLQNKWSSLIPGRFRGENGKKASQMTLKFLLAPQQEERIEQEPYFRPQRMNLLSRQGCGTFQAVTQEN